MRIMNGLGRGLSDVKGYKQATHPGGLAGIVTQITLLPEMKLGIVVFTNQQQGAHFSHHKHHKRQLLGRKGHG